MFAVHWQPQHRGNLGQRTDKQIFAAWGPPIVKIVWNGEKPPYLEDIPKDAKLLWRNYPLSEEFHGGLDLGAGAEAMLYTPAYRNWHGLPQNGSGRDLYSGPARARLQRASMATPEQAAEVYVANATAVAAYCATQGIGKERLLFEGPNEYPVWAQGYAGLARLEKRRLELMHRVGLWSVVSNLGVGWPGNSGPDTPPEWGWASALIATFGAGDYLGQHEYCGLAGVRENWGWWLGRILKCPYDVPIIITEYGPPDGGVYGASHAKQGYRNYPGLDSEDAKAKRCQDEMWEYASLIGADGRVRALCQYTYDGNQNDWANFETRTEPFINLFLPRIAAQGLPQPGATPPPPPEPEEPPTPPPPTPEQQIVGTVISQAPNADASYVYGHAWRDGIKIMFAWRGNPAVAETLSGPHAGYMTWQPGEYNFPLFVNGVTPCVGEWDIWATDGVRTSARVPFATAGPGAGVNQVEVDFALVDVAPEYASLTASVQGEAERNDVLRVNPDAALCKAGAAAGLWPTSNEYTWTYAGVNYTGQRFRNPKTDGVTAFYCPTGQWADIRRQDWTNL